MADAEGVQAVAGPAWVGVALDSPGEWHLRRRLPVLLGLMMLFDSWDSIAIAYTLPSISAEWHLTPVAAGWLVSVGYAGQFAGAILLGALAERRGRMPVLKLMVLAMAVFALLCTLTQSFEQLVAVRLIQGVAIGGGLPVATCYVNEIAPTATRGRFFGTFQSFMVAGFGLAALTSAWVVPHWGWRAMFALGALPLLLLPFLRGVPESPRWLAARGKAGEAADGLERLGADREAIVPAGTTSTAPSRVPITALFSPWLRTRSLVTAALWFLTSLVSFGLSTWIPSLYVSMFKVPVADALRYNLIATFAVFLLPILLRQTIDRFGRRPPVILGTAIGGLALVSLLVVPVEARALVVGLSVIGQIGISIGSMVLWPYTAETFDTRVRSVALGTFGSLARAASMLTPLLVGQVLQRSGSAVPVFWIFGLASLTAALLWILGTRETAGRVMDE